MSKMIREPAERQPPPVHTVPADELRWAVRAQLAEHKLRQCEIVLAILLKRAGGAIKIKGAEMATIMDADVYTIPVDGELVITMMEHGKLPS